MKIKRIAAYIIDTLIVTFISSIIFSMPIFIDYQEQYEDVYEDFIKELEYIKDIGSAEYDEERLLDLEYDMINSQKPRQIIDVGLLIIYFGVFAYISDGQTLGKKIFKIKVVGVKNKIQPHLFMLRSIILTNFIPNLVSIIVGEGDLTNARMNYIKNKGLDASLYINYFITFIIIGFMIFRDDERGLHDILCDTEVIDLKQKEK